MVTVLQSVLGMSEQAARNWFNGTETNELSIAQLVGDIKEYVDSKGKNFRLLFMVDEVDPLPWPGVGHGDQPGGH